MIFFPPPRVITGRNNYYRVVNEEKRRMLARNFHDGVSDYEERPNRRFFRDLSTIDSVL